MRNRNLLSSIVRGVCTLALVACFSLATVGCADNQACTKQACPAGKTCKAGCPKACCAKGCCAKGAKCKAGDKKACCAKKQAAAKKPAAEK